MDNYGIRSCEEFLRVMTAMKREMTRHAEAVGLTLQQAGVLHILREHGTILMGAVADRLHCDASNVTGIVERLTAMGYVERKELASDRRAKELHITDKGAAFVDQIRRDIPPAIGFTDLSVSEQKDLYRILTKLGA